MDGDDTCHSIGDTPYACNGEECYRLTQPTADGLARLEPQTWRHRDLRRRTGLAGGMLCKACQAKTGRHTQPDGEQHQEMTNQHG